MNGNSRITNYWRALIQIATYGGSSVNIGTPSLNPTSTKEVLLEKLVQVFKTKF